MTLVLDSRCPIHGVAPPHRVPSSARTSPLSRFSLRSGPLPLPLAPPSHHHSCRTVLARASPSSEPPWLPNPVELVKREAGLQSTRLDPAVRERVEGAVERLGGRVTPGDVAARAGVPLGRAEEALRALAYDTQAAMQVSSEGDLVYAFPPDFRSRLRSRSLLLRALPLARRAAGAAAYLARVAFGTALIASVVVVWLALLALLRGGREEDDRDRRGGGGYHAFHSARLFMDVTDLFFYFDPYYYRTSAQRVASGEKLSFVESIFSFVFGDGDPNVDFEETRWQRLGELIRARGGVVTAEEMAPFLDPPQPALPSRRDDSLSPGPYPDESFVLPALIKFGGEPSVDDAGRLLYRFPSLQRTGVKHKRWASRFSPQPSFDVPLERNIDFTAASPGQVAGTVTLGLLNLVGVALLAGALADPRSAYILAAQGLGWVGALLPGLQAYAAAFFAIPALRWFLLAPRNSAIDDRNEARALAAELLDSPPTALAPALYDKLAAAREAGERGGVGAASGGRLGPRLVGEADVVFDSGREAAGQADELESAEWEARMAARGRGRERGATRGSAAPESDGWGR